jgi:ankyrin repeat protein
MHAAQSAEMVQLLMDHHADPEEEEKEGVDSHYPGLRPLHTYTLREDIGAMLAVLQHGAKVDPVVDLEWWTPLHYAEGLSIDVVMLLLEFGADLKKKSRFSRNSVHQAAKAGKADVLRLLLQLWPEGIKTKDRFGDTPLHYAAEAGESDAVRLLVEHWPDGRKELNCIQKTPLRMFLETHVACSLRKKHVSLPNHHVQCLWLLS